MRGTGNAGSRAPEHVHAQAGSFEMEQGGAKQWPKKSLPEGVPRPF